MKSSEILVGGTYLAKVSGRVVPVRVLGPGPALRHGRAGARESWRCLNTTSGREILVRSPQRFRARAQNEGSSAS